MSPMTQATAPSHAPRIDTGEAAERFCAHLMETVAELVALLDRETGLLRSRKPQDIVALHARKSALGATLATGMETLRRDAEFIRMAAPEQLDALRAQQKAFENSLLANQEALAAMKAVSESLLRAVAAKAGERRGGPETYGKDAAVSGTRSARSAAISFDKSL